MLASFLHQCGSTPTVYDYCFYEADANSCKSLEPPGSTAQNTIQFSSDPWTPTLTGSKLLYIAEDVVITDTQYTTLASYLIDSSNNFVPTGITLAQAAHVTLKLTKATTIAGTLSLPEQYKIADTPSLTVTGLCTINPSVVTKSQITTNGGLVLLFADETETFTNLFTQPGSEAPLFVVGANPVSFTFKVAPEKVTFAASSYSFAFNGGKTIATDIPPTATAVSNVFETLNLDIQADLQQSLTFKVKDEITSSIVVSGPVTTLAKPITISGLTTNNVPTVIPINIADFNGQSFFVTNTKLTFLSSTDICVYHKSADTSGCTSRQLVIDTDKSFATTDFLNGKHSVMFITAELDVSAFTDLALTEEKWVCSGGLALGVAAKADKTTVSFPEGVTFASTLDAQLTVKSFAAPISSIKATTGNGMIVTSAPKLTLAAADQVGELLSLFTDAAEVTLLYSNVADFDLTTVAPNTNINEKAITISHSIIISSTIDIASFTLTWPVGNQPTKKITLLAKSATRFSLGKGFASVDTLVTVKFTDQAPTSVDVSCTSPVKSTPFVTDPPGTTFVYNVAICVYTMGKEIDCDGTGTLDTELAAAQVSSTQSITFHGDCNIEINVFVGKLNFGDTDMYHFQGTLKLTNINGAATTYGPIVLVKETSLGNGLIATQLTTPLSSISQLTAVGILKIPKVTLLLDPKTAAISETVALIQPESTITFGFLAAPKTLGFADGSKKSVKVTYGTMSFDTVEKQKYIFGQSATAEITITASALESATMPATGTYSLPITPTTKISFDQAKLEAIGYLTLTGIDTPDTKLLVVYPNAVVPSKGPLVGANLIFQYVISATSYCFVPDSEPHPECFAITPSTNAVGFSGTLLAAATYIRVVGEISCDIKLFTVQGASNTVQFPEDVFEFVGKNPALALNNGDPLIFTAISLIDNVHIAKSVTTTTITAPIESLPTDQEKVTTDEATIKLFAGEKLNPSTTNALSTLLPNKATVVKVNLQVRDTEELTLTYDANDKQMAPSFCFVKIMKFSNPINYQSAKPATSFQFEIEGQTQTDGKLDLGTVAVTTETTLSLGNGFSTPQQPNLLSLTFAVAPIANVVVQTMPNFDKKNEPFKKFSDKLIYDYQPAVPNICVYAKSDATCPNGYTKVKSTDITQQQIHGATKVHVADEMALSIEVVADASGVLINNDKFVLDGRLTLQVTKSVTFTTVEIEMGMNVVITVIPPENSQLLAIITPTFTTLSCEAKVVDTVKGAVVENWNIFVDPFDTKTYMIIDDANIKVSAACNFQVKGTEAKIVFKPSDEEGKSTIALCSSTYSWPSSQTIAFTSTTPAAKLSQVDVDFVKSTKVTSLVGSYTVDLSDDGKLKILDGLSEQPQKQNPFTVTTQAYTVQYPESMSPNNYFIEATETIKVETWSPPAPPTEKPKENDFPGWAIAVIVIVVVIVIAVVVVLVLNFTGVIHLCGNRDDAPSV